MGRQKEMSIAAVASEPVWARHWRLMLRAESDSSFFFRGLFRAEGNILQHFSIAVAVLQGMEIGGRP
jgi:hypothetical protein